MSFFRPAALAVATLALVPVLASAAVSVPLPWEVGLQLAYDSVSVDERENNGVSRKTTTTMITTIEVVESTEKGFVQVWRDFPATVRVEGNGADNAGEEKALMGLQKSFEGLAVEAALDERGIFTGVRNWQALGNRLRVVMTPIAMVQAKDDVDKAALKERLDSMVAKLTTESAVTTMVGKNPSIYNLFTAPALVPGKPVQYEDAMPSPVSEASIPTIGVFELVSVDEKAGTVTIHWQQDVDPVKGAAALWTIMEALMGPMPGAVREGLPKEIQLKDEATVVLNRSTGVPMRLDYVRHVSLGDAKRKMSWSFVLKDE